MTMNDWPIVKLGEVLRRTNRFEVRDDLVEYPFAGTYSFARGIFVGERKHGSTFALPKVQRIHAGDFIYCKIMAWEGAFGIAPKAADNCVMSGAFVAYELDRNRIDEKFLDYFFKVPDHWRRIGSQSTGTNVRRQSLHPDQFELSEMPLPPLIEQQRVVARVEGLLAKLSEVRTLRQQAILETEALTRSYLNELFGDFYGGVTGRAAVERWEKVGAVVTDVADGPHITPQYVPEGIPFITVLNITSGRIRFGNHKFVTPEDHAQFQRRAKAEPGDVLISKDGTIGVPCLVDTDRAFSFFVSVALIKPKREMLDGEFLTWVIRAPYLQERISARSRGDMIRHLVLREIRDLIIPVPPLIEQRRLVRELSELQAEVDVLKRLQAETSAEMDAMTPSILNQAFSGAL